MAILKSGTTVGGEAVVVTSDSRLSDARTPTAHTQDFSTITNTPTTISGYGITDADTSTEVNTKISTAISNLVNGADAAFDTLKEIQDAMATDTELATAISNLSIPTDNSQLANGAGYITGIDSTDVTTALGYTPYNATNPSGFISDYTVTSSDVTTALGYTPYNATNPNGYISDYTVTSSDVTTALGFTPYNATNPSGYITGINSSDVTTALGYTPYNATNPSGYITGINSSDVTTALGYTPYNATNPSGYISDYTVTKADVDDALGTAAANDTYFYRGDGTWATPSGGGSVTEAAIEAALTNVSFGDGTIEFNGTPLGDTGSGLAYDGDPVYHAGNNNIGTGSSNYAAGNHSHYNLNSDGTWASSPATIANGDRLVIVDSSSSNKINHATLTFGTGTTTFLANNGTWQTPSGGGGGATILYDDSTTTLTVSSTSYSTPTGTPELSLSANKKYYIRCMGTYAASTVGTGLGLSAYFSSSTGVTILGGKLMVMDTGTTSGVTSEDTAPWQDASVVPGSSANSMLATTGPGTTQTYFGFDGFVQVGSTATTVKIAFRTEVSATSQYIYDVALYGIEVA